MSAHVRDIQVIREFRAAVLEFIDEATSSLEAMLMELQRGVMWVEQDRPRYWTNEVRKGFDKVAETRVSLNRCQMRTVAGQRSSCIEEKQAFAKAKLRLQHCQEQVDQVKRWTVKVRHDSDEFRARLSALKRLLEIDLPQACALLEQTAAILESYAEIVPPSE
jgi:sensor histidine kinase regulating citrate/malate metabolism